MDLIIWITLMVVAFILGFAASVWRENRENRRLIEQQAQRRDEEGEEWKRR